MVLEWKTRSTILQILNNIGQGTSVQSFITKDLVVLDKKIIKEKYGKQMNIWITCISDLEHLLGWAKILDLQSFS